MAHLDALFQTLALHYTGTETTRECITGAIRIIDLLALDDRHFILFHVHLLPWLRHSYDRRIRALRADDYPRPLLVHL